MNAAAPAGGRRQVPALVVGLLAGIIALFLVGPADFMLRRSPAVLGPSGDMAQALGGAIAFVGDAWRFPFFDVGNVMTEGRQNIIFTDSIPAYALLWKLAAGLVTPDFRFYLPGFVVFTIVMQGLSAALVLRWLGVTSAIALLAGAVLFTVWPIFAFRFMMQHLALTSHWLIILGIGLLLTAPLAGAGGRRNLGLWCALVVLALLIHGYFFAFITALFLARLAIDRAERMLSNRRTVARAAAFLGLSAFAMIVSGHVGGPHVASEGFGYFSMNLAAAVIPAHTSLFLPNWMVFPLGQADGYNYVPVAGLILLLLAVALVIAGPFGALPPRLLSRRGTLIVVLLALALTAFAVSNQVWFADTELVSLPLPAFVETLVGTFRSSGRFFWVVSYLVLAFTVAILARRLPYRVADALLVVAAVAATIEMTPLRNLTEPVIGDYASDPAFLDVMEGQRSASVYPPYPCNPESTAVIPHQIQLLAARQGVLVENGFVSPRPDSGCPDGLPASLAPRPEPGKIVILLDASHAIPALAEMGVDEGACRQRRDVLACLNDWSDKPALEADFVAPKSSLVAPPARFTFFGNDPTGTPLLSSGFSGVEEWGTWSGGPQSQILVPLNREAPAPTRITLTLGGFVPPQRPEENLRVSLSSRASRTAPWVEESIADLTLTEAESRREVTLSRPATQAESIRITLTVDDPVSPKSLGVSEDERALGVLLFELAVE